MSEYVYACFCAYVYIVPCVPVCSDVITYVPVCMCVIACVPVCFDLFACASCGRSRGGYVVSDTELTEFVLTCDLTSDEITAEWSEVA